MSVIIQHKRGTALQWTTLNPTLEAGEVGWESDTNKFKIGTGSTVWTSLPYATLTPTELSSTYAKLVGGNAFTDAQTITSTAIGQVPLSIIPFTGQTASTFRVRNSTNSADLMSIDSSGQIRTTTILNPNSFNNSRLLMQDTGILMDTGVTTNIPLAVRGSNGQTADLQRWQSWNGSTATTVARIDSGGNLKATNVATLNSIGQLAESNSGALFVMGRATAQASSPGLNAGTLYFRDGTTSGTLRLATRTGASGVEETIVDNLSSTGSTAGAQFVGAGGVRTVGLINTNSSQYGNALLWSAPASTTYYLLATLPTTNAGTYDHLKIDATYGGWTDGQNSTSTFIFSNRNGFFWKHYLSGQGTIGNIKFRAYSLANGSVEIWVSGEAGQFLKCGYNISSAQNVTTVANPVSTTTAPTGTLVFDSSNVSTYVPSENKHGALNIFGTTSGTIPLFIRGASGQSVNLQEWQTNTPTTVASISQTGKGTFDTLNAPNGAYFGNLTSQPGNGAYLAVQGYAPGQRPFMVRGFGATTANLVDYQDGSANIVGGISGVGQTFSGSTAALTTSVGGATTATSGTGTVATVTTTSAHGLAVGDIVTIAGITPTGYNGGYSVASTPTTTSFTYANTTTGSQTVAGTVRVNAQASITSRSPSTIGLLVRAAASQVSNPFEVQNSSGTVIANITSVGGVRATGTLQGSTLSSTADGSTIATLSASGNVQFRGAASYGSGVGVIGIANATTAPSTSPTGGGILFVNSGALQYRGTSGGNATLVNADGTTPYLGLGSSYFAGHNTEGRIMYNAYLTNDMANARLRGSAVSATQNGVAYTISNADWDAMFDGTASFLNISPTSGFTFPLVITVPLPRTLTYGASVGISFGSTSFRANSVQIEVFSLDSSSWVSVFNTTTNTSEDIFTAVSGLTNGNAAGINQVRYTISSPNSTQLRIAHLWAYNFNSDMWSQTMMPRAGGAFYGAIRNNNTGNGFGVSGAPGAWGGFTPTVEIRGSSSSISGINFFMNGGPFVRAYDSSGNPRGAWANDGSIVAGPSNTKLGTLSVYSDASGTVGQVIRGASGQSVDLFRTQDNNANTLSKIDFAGKIFVPGGTTIYDYAVESGGSTDTAWKKLIEVNCASGLYTGASYEIEVVDSFDNYGIIDRVPLRFKFYVKITRTGGVQDDVLAASVTGPSVNYVRVVKTSNSLYEIQVRQPDVFRIVSFKARRVGQNNTSESYNPSGTTYLGLPAGSTTGTIYVPVNDSTTSANFLVDNFSQVSANRMTIQPLGTLAATTPLLTLTGTSTQNSNYAEFRNSGGTILSRISNDGSWNQGLDSTRTFISAASGRIQVVSSNSTAPGILLKPFAANYAGYDHMQYRNSADGIIGGINVNGQIYTGSIAPLTTSTGGAINGVSGNGTLVTFSTTNAHNLSNGDRVTIAGLTPAGYNGTYIISGVSAFSFNINNTTTGAATGSGTVRVDAQVSAVSRSAATVGIVVRGATSQVTDIQQWQISDGTVRAYVTADGSFLTSSTLTTMGNLRVAGTAGTGGGSGVIGIANAGTAPVSNPSGGGVLFVSSGALQYRGTSGSNSTIINADGTNPLSSTNNTFSGVQTFNNAVNIGSGLNSAVGLEMGYTGNAATTPFIDFHSGATSIDFDSRIIASGGNGTNGQGTLTYTAATSAFTGAITANGRLTLKPVANAANQSNGILISNTSDAWQSGLYLKTDGSGNPRLTLLAPTGSMGEAVAIDAAAKVGIGITDPSAQLTVVSALSNRVASIVRGASGQSVNIQEWQTNTPTTVTAITSTGNITTSAGISLTGANSPINLPTGGNGTSGQVLTSSGSGGTPTWRDGPVDGTTSTSTTGFGFMGLPQNSTTTGSYTVVAADAGKHIYASATRTVTINSNANLALPIGTTLTFIAGTGATMTIAITSDTMYLAGPGTTGSRTLAPFGMATAVKITSTSWMISGNGLT